jgi:AcrR family transcriptional regulator
MGGSSSVTEGIRIVAGQRKAQVVGEAETSGSATPAPGRRERNKQEKLARIVAAARRLFRERGFAETTTQQIAEAADIGTGTLFLYARSKEDLLVLVFRDEMLETARAAFSTVDRTAPLLDQLMQVFTTMLDYHEEDPAIARILLREVAIPNAAGAPTDISELLAVIFSGLADLVTSALPSEAPNSDGAALLAAENLFANYYLALLARIGGRMTRKQFLDRLRRLIAITVDGVAG